MSIITSFILALATVVGAARQPESNALRQTAPHYLATDAEAAVHLAAATYAGEAFSVDPALLLSIVWYESRYDVRAVTRERSGRLSCGLTMVTMRLGEPCPEPSVFDSYLRGAEHLNEWVRMCRGDLTCAMRGYAGGFPAIEQCAAQQEAGSLSGACARIEARHQRAAWIRTKLQRSVREGASS
jgi:hypothetical protein